MKRQRQAGSWTALDELQAVAACSLISLVAALDPDHSDHSPISSPAASRGSAHSSSSRMASAFAVPPLPVSPAARPPTIHSAFVPSRGSLLTAHSAWPPINRDLRRRIPQTRRQLPRILVVCCPRALFRPIMCPGRQPPRLCRATLRPQTIRPWGASLLRAQHIPNGREAVPACGPLEAGSHTWPRSASYTGNLAALPI